MAIINIGDLIVFQNLDEEIRTMNLLLDIMSQKNLYNNLCHVDGYFVSYIPTF